MSEEKLKLLIQAMLDGCITESDLSALESELENSEHARRLYIECSEIHSLLGESASVSHVASNVVPIDRILKRQRSKTLRLAALAAVAMLVIGLVTMSLIIIENRPALAFETSPGSKFTLTHAEDSDEKKGMVMEVGSRLQLSRGMVELDFASGVRSIVRAPAEIVLRDEETLLMNHGTAWFEVPENAEGFTVTTKELNVVDLGTEFGVMAKPVGNDEVHVFKGKVEVSALHDGKETLILVANEAVRNLPAGSLDSIVATPSVFLKNLTELPPYLHWSFDEKDQFAVKGSHPAVKDIVCTPSPKEDPPELVEGKFGSALSLNGNQQSVVSEWMGIYGADRPLSTAVWVRIPEDVDLTGLPAIVGWGIPFHSMAKWKLLVTHRSVSEPAVARISMGGDFYDGQTRLNDNRWHHIAVVFHGRSPATREPDVEMYVDGRRESLTHHTAEIITKSVNEYEEIEQSVNARPLTIGKGPRLQNVTFRGLIDELYIFDGAISESEIQNLISPKSSTTTKTK